MMLTNAIVLTEQRMSAGFRYAMPFMSVETCFFSSAASSSIVYDIFYFLKPFSTIIWILGVQCDTLHYTCLKTM